MINKFNEKLIQSLKMINVNINGKVADTFHLYMELILEWNEKMNLTAIKNEDDIILKHFVDSLTVLKYLKSNKRIVDIGTGAGFPGIPLAIVKKDAEFKLVDSLNKRINFLNEVKNSLNLENVQNLHYRAEEFGKNKDYREQFDIAVSRAVANLSTLVEYLLPLVKIGGKVICMKGSNIEEELNQAKYAVNELGGKIKAIEEFVLPETDIKRTIIIFEKVKNTPQKYPRKAGIPAKQPLKKQNYM